MIARLRWALLAALVGLLGVASSGCEAELTPGPVYAEGYVPMYYDGYVVYYDAVGRPYYYVGGSIFWVPPAAPVYPRLVEHWQVYGPAYHRWYAERGYSYRGYRRPYGPAPPPPRRFAAPPPPGRRAPPPPRHWR